MVLQHSLLLSDIVAVIRQQKHTAKQRASLPTIDTDDRSLGQFGWFKGGL